MDRLIKRFDAIRDGDLRVCAHRGVAYQKNMNADRVPYDAGYLAKVQAYEGSAIARAVNAGRCALLARHLPAAANVLDYGAGSGEFMRAARTAGFRAMGFDVIPEAADALRVVDAYGNNPNQFDALTLWDTIEHLEEPERVLGAVRKGALLCASVPIFQDLRTIRDSKHYRPGEHLYYWTRDGFVDWMALYGFRLLEESAHEVEAGREGIGAFAFRRDLPDYDDHIAAYTEMHATRYYGHSATELCLEDVARVVRALTPASILDYGCGRSDLVAHFWRDGKRRIARFDPAVGPFKTLPEGPFDLLLCTDVLEHVPMASVDHVLTQLRSRGKVAFLTISLKPARARLPDGRNAHVTLLTKSEWTRWLEEYFGPVQALPSKWDHELVALAGTNTRIQP